MKDRGPAFAGPPRLSIIKIIFLKEMLETFRDRRTLLRVIALPILLYPLLFLGASRFINSDIEGREARSSKVAVWGAIPAVLEEELDANRIERTLTFHGAPKELQQRIESGELGPVAPEPPKKAERSDQTDDDDDPRSKTEPPNPIQDAARKLVATKTVDAVVVAWPGLVKALEHDEAAPITIYFDSVEDNSDKAKGRVVKALGAARRRVIERREKARALGDGFGRPIEVALRNMASQERKSGQILGMMMPYMLVLMALMGAMYPAIDLTAGEKERGTMQTLLCAPLRPLEIVMGKFLAVWSISTVAALANLVSMGLTAKNSLPGDVHISPSAYALALVMILPVSGLLSALFIALCAFAKDFKDAQNVVMPAMLPLTFSGVLVFFPQMKLDAITAFVPLLNVELLIKAAFAGEATAELIFLTVSAAILYAVLALVAGARVFERENVLLGGGSPFKALFAKSENQAPPEATPTNALFAISATLVAIFYASSALARFGVLYQVVLVQAVMLTPTIVSLGLRFPARATFGLAMPTPRGLLGGALLGASAGLVVLSISARLIPVPEKFAKEMAEALLLNGKPFWVLILVLAVLPGVVEELLFRGLVFSGFRRLGLPAAMILSALLFGFAHGSIYRMLPTFSLGLLLAYTREKTGSIVPGMLLHALNNGLAIGLLYYQPSWAEASKSPIPPLSWTLGGAVVMLVALFLVRGSRSRAAPTA